MIHEPTGCLCAVLFLSAIGGCLSHPGVAPDGIRTVLQPPALPPAPLPRELPSTGMTMLGPPTAHLVSDIYLSWRQRR